MRELGFEAAVENFVGRCEGNEEAWPPPNTIRHAPLLDSAGDALVWELIPWCSHLLSRNF